MPRPLALKGISASSIHSAKGRILDRGNFLVQVTEGNITGILAFIVTVTLCGNMGSKLKKNGELSDTTGLSQTLAVAELLTKQHDDAILIGGVATMLWCREVNLPFEVIHELDFVVGLSCYSALRDEYYLVRDAKLAKQKLTIGEIECDIYVERQNNLGVPYPDIAAGAKMMSAIRVADVVSLLILKLDAYADRRSTNKGFKDLRDIGRLLCMIESPDVDLMLQWMMSGRLELLRRVARDIPWLSIAGGNSQEAAKLAKRGRPDALTDLIESKLATPAK